MNTQTGSMVGIDLGTTNTVVAFAAVQGQPPRLIENGSGAPSTPSVVSLKVRKDKEELLVGATAVDNQAFAPKDTIRSIKRLMGRGFNDPEVNAVRQRALYQIVKPTRGTDDSLRVILGKREYSPIEISALILLRAKADAEHRLSREVTHAVITVPAYFSQVQLDATRKAGQEANLQVLQLLDEPTAAAIAYEKEIDERTSNKSAPRTILVYDLGGGTFDVSILTYAGGTYSTDNKEGDMWLGGDDFDDLLEERVLEAIRADTSVNPLDPQIWKNATEQKRFMADLRKEVQKAKHTLTNTASAEVLMSGRLPDDEGNQLDIAVEVTRRDFEQQIKERVDRTHEIVSRALSAAGLTEASVDWVIMAGNSTLIPMIQSRMEARFGADKVLRSLHPKHCVAMGAAAVAAGSAGILCGCGHFNALDAKVCARCKEDLVRSKVSVALPPRVAPFSYGIQAAGDELVRFVTKNDQCPTPGHTEVFRTRQAGQRIMSYTVYGGENLEKASSNEKQGQAFAVLPAGLPEKAPIRVTLALDNDGIFELTAQLDDRAGTLLKPWIVKGETDDLIIKGLERTEVRFAELLEYLPNEQRSQALNLREQVFQQLESAAAVRASTQAAELEFDRALETLKKLDKALSGHESRDLEKHAESAVGFAKMLVSEYGWAFPDKDQLYTLGVCADQVGAALESRDSERVSQSMERLKQELEHLPENVETLVHVRIGIAQHIQKVDPRLATDLNAKLQQAEQTVKRGGGIANLQQVVSEVARRMDDIQQRRGNVCRHGHPVPEGVRFCPIDGDDLWAGGRAHRSN